MYSSNYRCGYDLCAWGNYYVVGLDVGSFTNFLGLEPKHKSPYQGLSCPNPRARCFVILLYLLLEYLLLTGLSGFAASIVRFPYIYQLTETQDFLWSNTDVSIWSTVEPGVSITAASMATMRPLFVAFFSRSKLFGSTTCVDATYTGSTSWPGYFRRRENTDVEELELRSGLGNGILVTTTITNTQSTRTGRNKRTNTSESEMPLK
jgi:hypothetical protein